MWWLEREPARESGPSNAMDHGLMCQILARKFYIAFKMLTRLDVHRKDLLFHGVSFISWIFAKKERQHSTSKAFIFYTINCKVKKILNSAHSAFCVLNGHQNKERYSINWLVFMNENQCSSETSPTRCNNCVFILRNGFTLHVSGDNLTHHQEYICCIWQQVSRLAAS